MTKIFSNILMGIMYPLNWVLVLLAYALLTRRKGRKSKALVWAFFILLFFTNPFFSSLAFYLWEVDPQETLLNDDHYEVGIVLGGFTVNDSDSSNLTHFNRNFERLTNATELYNLGIIDKIMISGGNSSFIKGLIPEARKVRTFLIRLGIPDEDIIVEDQSRNTFENAVYSEKIIREKYGNASCMLITSAFHMRRALACFRKAGLECTPFSSDVKVKRMHFGIVQTLLPSYVSLEIWQHLFREWVGSIYYKLRGYI